LKDKITEKIHQKYSLKVVYINKLHWQSETRVCDCC